MEEKLRELALMCPCPKITVEEARDWLATEGATVNGKSMSAMLTEKGRKFVRQYLVVSFGLEIIDDSNLSYNGGENMHAIVIQRIKSNSVSKGNTLQSVYKDWVVRTIITEDYEQLTFDTALRLLQVKRCIRKLASKAGMDLCNNANASITEDLLKRVK